MDINDRRIPVDAKKNFASNQICMICYI